MRRSFMVPVILLALTATACGRPPVVAPSIYGGMPQAASLTPVTTVRNVRGPAAVPNAALIDIEGQLTMKYQGRTVSNLVVTPTAVATVYTFTAVIGDPGDQAAVAGTYNTKTQLVTMSQYQVVAS